MYLARFLTVSHFFRFLETRTKSNYTEFDCIIRIYHTYSCLIVLKKLSSVENLDTIFKQILILPIFIDGKNSEYIFRIFSKYLYNIFIGSPSEDLRFYLEIVSWYMPNKIYFLASERRDIQLVLMLYDFRRYSNVFLNVTVSVIGCKL